MKLERFLSKPSRFRQREIIPVRDVKLISKSEDGLFTFNVYSRHSGNTYTCEILLNEKHDVKFHCDCESFRFQFSGVLRRYNSLLYPSSFSNKPPRHNVILYVCKHLEACINHSKGELLKYGRGKSKDHTRHTNRQTN